MLSQAGIDITEEAVVVAEGGAAIEVFVLAGEGEGEVSEMEMGTGVEMRSPGFVDDFVEEMAGLGGAAGEVVEFGKLEAAVGGKSDS
jgi:hypothetical protein